ncbi:MAG: ribonuclease E/G [Sphingomonadales bacterium]
MKTGLVIERHAFETRIAFFEEGRPVACRLARIGANTILGNIYRARVKTTDATLNAAFLDIGGAEALLGLRQARKLPGKRWARSISECLAEGQSLAVQIIREAQSEDGKLARASAIITIEGRYSRLQSQPAGKEGEEEEGRCGEDWRLSSRRAATGVPEGAVRREADILKDAWLEVAGSKGEPGLLREEAPALLRALRDAPAGSEEIFVNLTGLLGELRSAATLWPDLSERIALWPEKQPAFDLLGLEDRLEEVIEGRLQLPSGGYLLQAEAAAMTVFDVNMGRATANSRRKALLATNIEAARRIAHELRFQNIGGLVAVDFIDMADGGDRKAVVAEFKAAAAGDPSPLEWTGLSRFGILELRRKRTGPTLRNLLVEPSGPALRLESEAAKVLREAGRQAGAGSGPIVIRAGAQVIAWLEEQPGFLQDLALQTGRKPVLETTGSGKSKETQT